MSGPDGAVSLEPADDLVVLLSAARELRLGAVRGDQRAAGDRGDRRDGDGPADVRVARSGASGAKVDRRQCDFPSGSGGGGDRAVAREPGPQPPLGARVEPR